LELFYVFDEGVRGDVLGVLEEEHLAADGFLFVKELEHLEGFVVLGHAVYNSSGDGFTKDLFLPFHVANVSGARQKLNVVDEVVLAQLMQSIDAAFDDLAAQREAHQRESCMLVEHCSRLERMSQHFSRDPSVVAGGFEDGGGVLGVALGELEELGHISLRKDITDTTRPLNNFLHIILLHLLLRHLAQLTHILRLPHENVQRDSPHPTEMHYMLPVVFVGVAVVAC